MTYPVPWHNELGYGLTLGPVPDPTWDMSFDGVDYPPDYLPEEVCEGGKPTCMENWMYEAGDSEAFTNYTFISGQPTLASYFRNILRQATKAIFSFSTNKATNVSK